MYLGEIGDPAEKFSSGGKVGKQKKFNILELTEKDIKFFLN